jgi:mono/diheme cytochrome c family protein
MISVIALLALIVVLPVYALGEETRMQQAQEQMRAQYLEDGAILYIEYCATCHGTDGSGYGVMPALNHPALAEANPEALFKTIARAAHGTSMASWHINEGGVLNDYQIGELVTVIQFADWSSLDHLALTEGYEVPVSPAAELGVAYMESEDESDPHRCVACHEDPEVHLGRFGLNCARCHSSVAWTPALLTKHTFLLDHGGNGQVECKTCHPDNYYTHTCYDCHDHNPDEMNDFHLNEGLQEFDNCIDCHATGVEGEAERLQQQEQEQAIEKVLGFQSGVRP